MSPLLFLTHLSFFFLLVLTDGNGLKIVRLAVPMSVPNRKETGVLLDCDYSLELSSTNGLVVKWFLNDAPNPVYQWIQGRRPQDLGLLKGRLDLDYKASSDQRKEHRALKIRQVGPELSGDYTCLVSTFDDEARQTKRMTVYTPAERVDFSKEEAGEEITLRCIVIGVHPEPRGNISSVGKPNLFSSEVETVTKDGLYDSEAKLTFNRNDLTATTTFTCDFRIPDTDYIIAEKLTITPAVKATQVPQRQRTTQVSAPESGVTAPNHYDPDIFFIRTYHEGASSGSSVEAAAFSIFLLSFLTVRV